MQKINSGVTKVTIHSIAMTSLAVIFFFSFISLLTACSSAANKNIDTANLNQLQGLTSETSNVRTGHDIAKLRSRALQDTAMSLGAQGGLAWASTQINARLEKDKSHLDTVYNFSAMMLSHGVLPPVLVEGNNSLNLADPTTIRIADKTYVIAQQARFATTPPNWREFLWLSFSKPEVPDKAFLPRNCDERKAWSSAIKIGWEKGIQQAYSIFQQGLGRLKRDYQGMITYRRLLQQRMVSAPFVSTTSLGVTGSGSDMRINDQVLRITELPRLQTDTRGWKAIVVSDNDN